MTAELALIAKSDAQIDALYDEAQRKKDVRGIARYTAEIGERQASILGWAGATLGLSSIRGVGFPLYEKWTKSNQIKDAKDALTDSTKNLTSNLWDVAKPVLIGVTVLAVVLVAVHGYAKGRK